MGCKELPGVSNGYMGLQGVRRCYRWLTGCYKRVRRVTGGCRVKKGLQGDHQEVTGGYYGVTRSYNEVLLCGHKGVTRCYKGLQGVTVG